ncbi:hypothetical protein NXC12_CH01985 [Rhizobium etli]|uniref:Uncharacterized protein n=1 Tax=Rhizobium etli TaxID=29449 RepID=A0AAN1BFA4_RHIET|nr:hypothetical protein REMIM1_CH01949 [Rhizobium etli bv. mimosae str. Mim1]ARQ10013.1 hypothetical protein NXC12_CH01985 [Rhizobium etli]
MRTSTDGRHRMYFHVISNFIELAAVDIDKMAAWLFAFAGRTGLIPLEGEFRFHVDRFAADIGLAGNGPLLPTPNEFGGHRLFEVDNLYLHMLAISKSFELVHSSLFGPCRKINRVGIHCS